MALKLRSYARERIFSTTLAVSIVLVMAGLGYTLFENYQVHTLVLAAGGRDEESYVLAEALATVVERHYPHIHLVVRETGGTSENLAMLSDGRAQLAAAQADVPTGPRANLLAVLYRDDLQVFVRNDANVTDFRSLRGKRIGLTRRGGQYRSFLAVADRLGLTATDFEFVGDDDSSADRALLDKRVDAVFRVRALGNRAVEKLVQTNIGHFIPIEEVAGLIVKNSAFQASTIPRGVYAGIPPQPLADTPTVSVPRTLLASRDTSPSEIYAVTTVLFSERREIAEVIPQEDAGVRSLLADMKEAGGLGGLPPPVHAGAKKFFDRDKPSFVLDHASFLGLLVTLGVLVFSWLRQLKHTMAKRRKTEGDRYADEIIQLMLIGQRSTSLFFINGIRSQLMVILTEAVCALDEDKISNEAFQNMRGLWEISVDLLREQAASLKNSEAEIAASLAQPVSSAETLAGDPLFARWGSGIAGEIGTFPLAQLHNGERSR
jgi:TRAP transporter TAXI family solute receptor